MPLTFIDIERQKNWRIPVFLLVLILLYFCISALIIVPFLPIARGSEPRFWMLTFGIALVIGAVHFLLSGWNTASTVIRTLNGAEPDRHDDVHRVFLNVMDELHVVTGNQRKIRSFVLPSLSLNALAVADLKGNAAIAITEGLLSRLTRPQLEAVIAHEAHHILSGDCLETTIAASLFGTYAGAVDQLRIVSRGRLFAYPAFVLAWLLLKLSYLLNMLISREREYRADAAAVRMSRNPIALAETLYLLSRTWRGAGFIGSGLEALCIVNPEAAAIDEADGPWADLLSTHPPLSRRMNLLLSMARVSVAELEAKATARENRRTGLERESRYYALTPQQEWQGPFTVEDLDRMPWLSPLTWVTNGEQGAVERAWKQQVLAGLFARRLAAKEKTVSDKVCPVCRQQLITAACDGVAILQCTFCAGSLVDNDKITRIIARTRREQPCSERIAALARAAVGNGTKKAVPFPTLNSPALLRCPQCGNEMHRSFYSAAHLVQIDRCSLCGLTWFDHDEIDMLRCLIGESGKTGITA